MQESNLRNIEFSTQEVQNMREEWLFVIVLDKDMAKTVKGYWTLSDEVLLIKIAGKQLCLNIIQIYAPTSTSRDEDIEKFYGKI